MAKSLPTKMIKAVIFSMSAEDLLRLITEMLNTVFDLDSNLLSLWAKPELVQALCEAMAQTR